MSTHTGQQLDSMIESNSTDTANKIPYRSFLRKPRGEIPVRTAHNKNIRGDISVMIYNMQPWEQSRQAHVDQPSLVHGKINNTDSIQHHSDNPGKASSLTDAIAGGGTIPSYEKGAQENKGSYDDLIRCNATPMGSNHSTEGPHGHHVITQAENLQLPRRSAEC